MEEFLRENYFFILHLIETFAAVTGLYFYKKYRATSAKYFIWFLVYIAICEFLARYTMFCHEDSFLYFLEGTLLERNFWWSTLFWKIGAILFFTFYYYKILETDIFKKIIKGVGYSFFSFSSIFIILNWKDLFIRFFPILSVLGALVVFICVTIYLIEALKSDKLIFIYKSLSFYITLAIFIWWLIITPLVFYDIYSSTADWNFVFLKWQIYLIANIFMYGTFTIGLIVSSPENEKI
ncbi:hypothetical protein [Bizionia arctica]|uniref:Uncharacterized protein n=1 Tax=Bizionia arctica TaxID=1495645 RepID=A0A917GH03_9FLAO|nr:hypothetical protein [Bizionia arctica]GGG45088.1 hypothetical protein GCM10010976_15850 [Bizionia arctica]